MHIDDMPLAFGKHMFKTPEQVSETDPGYIVWLYENVEPKVVSKVLYQYCQNQLECDEEYNSYRADEGDDHYS